MLTQRITRSFCGCAALFLTVVVSSSPAWGSTITLYTTHSAFAAAEPGLPVQNFAGANLFSQPYVLQAAPLNSGTNDAVFAAGSILPGLTIGNKNPSLAAQGLIVEAAGVGTNYFGDDLILSFAPGVFAVGSDVFANTAPGYVLAGAFTEKVYSGSKLLGSHNFSEAAGVDSYAGVASSDPITSVDFLYTTDDASTFANNIAFGPSGAAATPEPSSVALLGTGMLLLIAEAKRRQSRGSFPPVKIAHNRSVRCGKRQR